MSKKISVLAAFDKFKDCLSSKEVGDICVNHLNKLFPGKLTTQVVSLSDGGEGFLSALKNPFHLEVCHLQVTGLDKRLLSQSNLQGPLGGLVQAEYGFNKQKGIAIIEMASACGLEKVPKESRNPLFTTTKGVGELILHAYKRGLRRFILGVGGSSTNDAGFGALEVLGMKIIMDETVKEHRDHFIGKDLSHVKRIEIPKETMLPGSYFEICCDVNSPFLGPKGAVYTYGKQKGAGESDLHLLEEGMNNVSKLLFKSTGVDISNLPGSGAAGGISGGFAAVFGAHLRKGVDIIMEAHQIESKIQTSQLVLTGEGYYDSTSSAGKVPHEVVVRAQKAGVPVIIICGKVEEGLNAPVPLFPTTSLFSIHESMRNPKECIEKLISKNSKNWPVLRDLSKNQDIKNNTQCSSKTSITLCIYINGAQF